ncbi:unnamed protein product [Effrenium voratum]|nr:unnamed protein product [Effrenium voratum]
MTGCRLTIFTLSVVFGKSFPKHVSLVKARFGDVLGSGRQGTARGCKGVVSDSQFFLTSRALCPDFDVQIFSQRRALELPFCHFLLAACRWIQFVLLGTLWLCTCADWCQLGL